MNKLLLIDGHSILNRAYYGVPDLTNSEGKHTNAIYGFLNMLFKYLDTEKPTHLLVAFDTGAPTFRHEMFSEYKGTRKPMDPELREQVPIMQDLLTAMNIPIVKKEGYEADDILGTISHEAEEKGFLVTIMSGDRDMLQLATDNIKISIPKTKRTGTEIEDYFAKDVLSVKGVTPEEFIDVKALMGDSSDNIPGVPGIGEKTATAIIQKYHNIETAHENAEELKPPRASKNIVEFYDQAVLSKKLAIIDIHAKLDYSLNDAVMSNPFTDEAYDFCKELELKSLLPRFEKKAENKNAESGFKTFEEFSEFEKEVRSLSEGRPVMGFSVGRIEKRCDAISVSDGEKTLLFKNGSGMEKDFSGEFFSLLNGLLKDKKKLSGRDIKEDLKELPEAGYENIDDVSLMAYLLNPLSEEYPSDDIARTYLAETIPSFTDLFGKTKGEKAFKENPEGFFRYLCFESYVSARSVEKLKEALKDTGMLSLYEEIELPLCFTLSDMEKEGIEMDKAALLSFGEKLSVSIKELEKKIYDEAGEEFNINSPKQLGEILFGKMQLPNGKKTKTGYSTAADVLEELAPMYPIVSDILSYRQYTKLRSTYVEGLSECVSEDRRVRSTFKQTVTATGRISSTDPNLQNIPIRMELGKEIRKVFYPKEGYVFLDADYSQIELRVLAHLSKDPGLIEAYKEGKDIHASTASKVFHIPFEDVTELDRRRAKAVNFGIVYGISAFGLAKDIHMSNAEAKAYIEDYFAAYPVLHKYLEDLKKDAKEKGYAITLFGRRRPVPELNSGNFMQRQFGERVAMNSPIQGSAADIIKIAMIKVHDRLKAEGLSSKLLLQVHDELLIETKIEEKEKVLKIMKEEMENAVELLVPLTVDVHEGSTWFDAK